MQVYIHTFGCKVNCFESSAMAQVLRNNGFTVVAHAATADIVVVNSCTVTENGDKKMRQYLRRVKRDNPDVVLVLAGCMPQAYPDKAAALPDIDLITGTGNRLDIAALINEYLLSKRKNISIRPNTEKAFELLAADAVDGHTRAFLKIEDGCERYCSYCIVPYARGNVRSMPPDALKQQIGQFVAHGYREIVLSGVNLSFYGKDLGLDLADAVAYAADVHGIERIRLGSLEPDLLPDDALTRLSKIEKLCPHFHLALQSGCDATLQRMARHYDTARFSAVANRIRELFDNPTFTTDVMVGFPGETETEFTESLDYVQSFGFLNAHVFPYSVRAGTAAETHAGQLDKETKTQRADRMTKATQQSRSDVMQSFVGQRASVLLEQPRGGSYTGYTERYLPALVTGASLASGDIVTGKIVAIKDMHAIVQVDNT